jgi:hypothetical protein
MFPVDPEGLAAGGQGNELLARLGKVLHERRGRLEQMLAVVQYQQQLFAAQELHQRFARALPGPGGDGEHRRDGVVHPGRAADGGQLAQPRAVTEPLGYLPRHL